MAGVVAPRSSSSSSSSSSSATNSRVSPANPPPMPEAEQLEAARRLATRALSELSRHDMSSSTSPPCGLPALLRRCLQLLPLLNAGDPSLAARCCRGLLASLGAILSRKPSPSLLPSLEVVAESLVFSERLRSYLAMADCAAPEGSRIFTEALPCQGVHQLTLELVCCHFISSLQDEGGFEVFLRALSWSWNESQGTPEISFQGALGLIHRTCLFSLPVVVQAHLLLLASRCISDQNLDLHLHAFEHAMNLYVRYLPALDVFNRTGGTKIPWTSSVNKRPFSCCIKDATDQKLRSQIDGLRSFCQLHSGDDLPTNESDIDRLIEENQHILHEMFRQESTVVLKDILLNILCCAKQEEVFASDTELSDGIICLAAVLRVMSSSLLHILHYFSQMRSASDKTNVNYTTLCMEYNVICEIICLLGQHEANELHWYNLLDIIGMPVDRKRASVLMLAHFATLSICCVRRRIGFLWKRCVVMMIMSVNLIAEEEGLGTFQLSTDVSKESAVFCNTEERTLEVSERAKAITSRYETIYKFHKGRHVDGDGNSIYVLSELNWNHLLLWTSPYWGHERCPKLAP
ncbi:uncharacterized protein LOC112878282 isoform X2 [Panicum hallii]|uniref:uncharacterized protein LOC112878282 isoform X2 n=1 Tax=Panicum hallii TaxID=206008 RepID=UPI000DF4DC1C|nr:uncharacterized protein LOC112878282 isoform X2 [Panicum hallii]